MAGVGVEVNHIWGMEALFAWWLFLPACFEQIDLYVTLASLKDIPKSMLEYL